MPIWLVKLLLSESGKRLKTRPTILSLFHTSAVVMGQTVLPIADPSCTVYSRTTLYFAFHG